MGSNLRTGFATRFGGIMAAAGSAVGLGNIWRFPTQAGENGGSAFIAVYLVCVLLFGIPLLLAEFVIGRHARANAGNAYKVLAPNTAWKWVGPLSVLIAFLILCYYNVVAGWVLCYTYDAVAGNFVDIGNAISEGAGNHFADNFTNFVSDPFKPLLCLTLFMVLTYYLITRGVQKGIERASKILMPALFVIMIILLIFALNMPGAKAGIAFLFEPDFSAITPSVVLSALAQCFYSLSLGMGLVTYASYFRKEDNLTKNAVSIGFMDTLVAVMAGLIIFPAVFSVPGMEPSAGASLVFIALPNVFYSALNSTPFLAWLMPVLFYSLLLTATLTSVMFLHEVSTAYVSETFGLSRHRSALIVSILVVAIGAGCSLSMGPWSEFKIAGLNLFDLFDTVTAKYMLPITGMLAALFVGWKLSVHKLWIELTSHGRFHFKIFIPFRFIMRFVAPILIAIIMISQL